jgi:hypothetical protein
LHDGLRTIIANLCAAETDSGTATEASPESNRQTAHQTAHQTAQRKSA